MNILYVKSNFCLTILIFIISCNLHAQEGTVVINQDKEIEDLLQIKKSMETSLDRYKIQIYSGLS